MSEYKYKEMAKNNIWVNNVVFAQMLALCPLLAVTSGATNGLGLGIITTLVMVLSSLLVSLIRPLLTPQVRVPIFILLIATLVTIADLAMNAWLHELHKVLGLFIPLIVTNCAILGRAESYASKNPWLPSMIDGFTTGIGFTLALVILGGFREVIGSGTLFANASLLLGDAFSSIEMTLLPDYRGMLLVILPSGGFIMLGVLLSGKRLLDTFLQIEPKKEQHMKFSVAHAAGSNSFWQEFESDEALTAEQAILQSGLLEQFPDLDIQKLKIGIFGKVCKTSQMVQEGDRIEVYLPATAKPADAEEES